jgi:hypothetical protein
MITKDGRWLSPDELGMIVKGLDAQRVRRCAAWPAATSTRAMPLSRSETNCAAWPPRCNSLAREVEKELSS